MSKKADKLTAFEAANLEIGKALLESSKILNIRLEEITKSLNFLCETLQDMRLPLEPAVEPVPAADTSFKPETE